MPPRFGRSLCGRESNALIRRKLGVERTQVMLNGGANDLGGTLMEETISRMAGSEFGSAKSVEDLALIAEGIGRPARQRTTTYAPMAA